MKNSIYILPILCCTFVIGNIQQGATPYSWLTKASDKEFRQPFPDDQEVIFEIIAFLSLDEDHAGNKEAQKAFLTGRFIIDTKTLENMLHEIDQEEQYRDKTLDLLIKN